MLLAATAVLAFGPPGPPGWWARPGAAAAAVVLPTGWYADRRAAATERRPVALFRAFLVVALIDVALLLTAG